ncbi:MAG: hypothetical protein JKY65_24265 [Planctomycetes bacterium]|nr:hypothetical protein [Planctomycetota bacterium]
MHILLGTIVGATFAVLTVVAFTVIRGKTPVLRNVLLAALGGAIAGAVTTATLGAGGMATAGIGREVIAFAIGGGSGGVGERVAENALEGQDLTEGVATAAGLGAAVGVLSLGAAKGIQAGGARLLPKRWTTGPPKSFLSKILAAKTTGTGSTWLSGARVPGTGRGFRKALENERPADSSLDPREAGDLPAGELGAAQVGAAQLGAAQVGAAQLGAAQLGAAQLGANPAQTDPRPEGPRNRGMSRALSTGR